MILNFGRHSKFHRHVYEECHENTVDSVLSLNVRVKLNLVAMFLDLFTNLPGTTRS